MVIAEFPNLPLMALLLVNHTSKKSSGAYLFFRIVSKPGLLCRLQSIFTEFLVLARKPQFCGLPAYGGLWLSFVLVAS
jgi:hypothetical protein